jgi:hypothetical protein
VALSNDGNAHASIDTFTDLGTGFLQFSASKAEGIFNKVLTSLPRRPSADTMKGKSDDVVGGKA